VLDDDSVLDEDERLEVPLCVLHDELSVDALLLSDCPQSSLLTSSSQPGGTPPGGMSSASQSNTIAFAESQWHSSLGTFVRTNSPIAPKSKQPTFF
jgi:hypothetical protein